MSDLRAMIDAAVRAGMREGRYLASDRIAMAGIDPLTILRVPFKDRGRDWSGWDCWGCVKVLSPLLYGFELPSFFDNYTATDFANRRALDALIGREMAGFEEGPPGEAFPILTFVRFGVRAHTALAINGREMIHADSAGSGGGTYRERYDIGDWSRRQCRAFRPRGWSLT